VFDLEVKVETRVDECYFGVFGLLNEDPFDCQWRRYYPQIPLFEISFQEEWDITEDYLEWECNYYDDLNEESGEPNNIDPSQSDLPFDLEPSNIVQ